MQGVITRQIQAQSYQQGLQPYFRGGALSMSNKFKTNIFFGYERRTGSTNQQQRLDAGLQTLLVTAWCPETQVKKVTLQARTKMVISTSSFHGFSC